MRIIIAIVTASILALSLWAAIEPPAGDVWLAWEVPSGQPQYVLCCSGGPGEKSFAASKRPCRLGSDQGSIVRGDAPLPEVDSSRVTVYVHYRNGSVVDVRSFSAGCSLDLSGLTVQRRERSTEESIRVLTGVMHAATAPERARKHALMALAVHQSPAVAAELERVARRKGHSLREEAIFWYAMVGGKAGFDAARDLARNDPDGAVRRKAVFALTQSKDTRVAEALQSLVRSHPDVETRAEAIFWLGQHLGEKARPMLQEIAMSSREQPIVDKAIFAIGQLPGQESIRTLSSIARSHALPFARKQALFWLGQKAEAKIEMLSAFADDEGDSELREMAVFAISQRPKDEAVPELIRLARSHRHPEVRKKAVFWLSQMNDERALAVIEKLVLEP